MARTTLIHRDLGWPFLRVREGLFVLMAGSRRVLNNISPKVLFVLDGVCSVRIDDVFSGDLEPGDVFINPVIGPQDYVSLRAHSDERIYTYGLYLEDSAVEKRVRGRHQRSLRDTLVEIMEQPAILKAAVGPEMRELLRQIRFEMEVDRPERDACLHALNVRLVVEVARHMRRDTESTPPLRRPADIIISGAKEYINKTQHSQVTLGGIALHLNLSPEHLSRVFQREEGISVMKYVQYCRIEHAKTLLLASSDNLRGIAARVGYRNVHSFIRNFKEQTGCNPTEYRQRHAG